MLRQTLEHKPKEAFQCNSGEIIPLDLPDDILQDIYYNNHARLHPHARPVNGQLILEDTQKLLDGITKRTMPIDKDADYSMELANLWQIQSYYSQK